MRRLLRVASAAVLVTLGSCSCGGSTKSAHGLVRADPTSVDFGDVAPGTTVDAVVKVWNDGNALVTLNDVDFKDKSREAFFVFTVGDTVPAGQSTTIHVSYTAPSLNGPDNAVLEISSDASNAPALDIPITARSVTPGNDAGEQDAGTSADAGTDGGELDGGTGDGGTNDAGVADAGAADAGAPDSGFLALNSSCGADAGLAYQVTLALVQDGGTAWLPRVAWANGRFVVIYADYPLDGGQFIYGEEYDETGALRRGPFLVVNSGVDPSVSGAGDAGYLVTYTADPDQRAAVTRIAADGGVAAGFPAWAESVATVDNYAGAAWDPVDHQIGLSWYEYSGGQTVVMFSKLNADGTFAQTEVILGSNANQTGNHPPPIVWTGNEWRVLAGYPGSIALYTVQRDGGVSSNIHTTASSLARSLSWNGSELLATFDRPPPSSIYYEPYAIRADDAGTLIGTSEVRLSSQSIYASNAVWVDGRWEIAWERVSGGNVYVSGLTDAGLGPPRPLSCATPNAMWPQLATNGDVRAVTFSDVPNGYPQMPPGYVIFYR